MTITLRHRPRRSIVIPNIRRKCYIAGAFVLIIRFWRAILKTTAVLVTCPLVRLRWPRVAFRRLLIVISVVE